MILIFLIFSIFLICWICLGVWSAGYTNYDIQLTIKNYSIFHYIIDMLAAIFCGPIFGLIAINENIPFNQWSIKRHVFEDVS